MIIIMKITPRLTASKSPPQTHISMSKYLLNFLSELTQPHYTQVVLKTVFGSRVVNLVRGFGNHISPGPIQFSKLPAHDINNSIM